MTLPAAPPISMSQVATELAKSLPFNLNSAEARALAGVPSGPFSFPGDFYGKSNALIASASPTDVNGFNSDTNQTTVTVQNAVNTLSYSWARISGSTALSAVSASAAATAFRSSNPVSNVYSATFRCTVTEAVTGRQATADVSASVVLFDPP